MKRGSVSALVLVLAFAGGCASPAKYVEKRGDSGIVAIPANTDAWPSYNRREAMALIEKHVGPNYEILEEHQVVVGQSTRNEQQTNTEAVANRRNPNLPGERQTTTGVAMTQDVTEWRIAYRRKDGPIVGDINNRGTMTGLAPAGGSAAQGAAPGVVPSVQPAVQPAGAVVPRGTTGTGSYMINGARPANPADCDH